jgi:hypothetical protein
MLLRGAGAGADRHGSSRRKSKSEKNEAGGCRCVIL